MRTYSICLALVVVLSGCGDDSTINPDTGAPDAGLDATGDATGDANADADLDDTGMADTGPDDVGPDSMDTGPDTREEDCASFSGLGDLVGGATTSVAIAISADGTTVVGQSDSAGGPEAMLWREADGMVGLGDLTGGSFSSRAFDVSADGTVVVGVSHSALVDCAGRIDEAFRWTEGTGMVALGDDPAGCFFSYAYATNGDGMLVAGGVRNALSNTAASWSSLTSMWTDLGFAMLAGNSSEVSAVTADGTVFVGGQRVGASAEFEAYRWTSAGQEILGDLPGGVVFGSARDVSDDGDVIVGFGTSASGREALRWTSALGIHALGDFEGGAFESDALAIASVDGTPVVGWGTSAMGQQAAIWETPAIMSRLADVLVANSVTIPAGWTLTSATDVTIVDDVISIVGDGTNPSGESEAWVARYCR